MTPSNTKKLLVQRNVTYGLLVPLIIGLHIAWFTLQQRYVPESDRHNHPLTRLYKKFTT